MMDSGNSGSMQSSSGGDEEYDSRTTDSMSFFNQSGRRVVGQTMGLESYSSSATFAPISNLPLQQHPPPPSLSLLPNHPPPTLFDLQAHSLQSYSHSSQNQAPNQNQNPPLYNTSPANNLDLVWSRSGPSYANPGTFGTQSLLRPTSSSSMALPSVIDGSDRRPTQRASDQQQPAAVPPKNSRKRTRASRRAPTTVLTTDTSNFRQMVQEFTGIPAAPFSAAASPYSRRLDLFGGGGVGGGMSGLMRSGQLETLGPLYPFRPSAQKFQPNNLSSFLAAPNSSNSISTTNNTLSTSAGTTNAGSSASAGPSNTGYQTTPTNAGVLLPKQQNQQSRDMLNMHNPFMAYQTLLQQQQQQPNVSHELGIAQEQADNNLGAFQNQDQQIGLENVSSRNNEGTLESWICPSD